MTHNDEADTLLIVYQRGFADGKQAAQRKPLTDGQQAEPVAWDKPSTNFNEWWDSYRHDPANPFSEGSAAYWAWAGWQAAQRPWQGLTDEEIDVIYWGAGKHDLLEARAIEAKLKEKNT